MQLIAVLDIDSVRVRRVHRRGLLHLSPHLPLLSQEELAAFDDIDKEELEAICARWF